MFRHKTLGQIKDQPRMVFEVFHFNTPVNKFLFKSIEPVTDGSYSDSRPFGDERAYLTVENTHREAVEAGKRRDELMQRGFVQWMFDEVEPMLKAYITQRVVPGDMRADLTLGNRRTRNRITVWIQH